MKNKGLGFQVYSKNELIVDVFINKDNMKVDVKQYSKYNHLRMFLDENNVTIVQVMDWLGDRCFPKNRANCDELLKMLGLKYYDVLEITRITHGLMMDDYIWIKWYGENITYDQIRIRE